MIVGASHSDSFQGAAYIFRFNGTDWIEEQKLTASDGGADGSFGASVALFRDVALVGATEVGSGASPGPGAAYVYRFDGSSWVEEQKLTASDGIAGDVFGAAVDLEADRAVVSAPQDFFADAPGAAYVFQYDSSSWVEEQKLTASDGNDGDGFGFSVAIRGDRVLVGSPQWLGTGEGAAYVFHDDGVTWSEEQKLTASDGDAFEFLGQSVSLELDLAVVSARSADGATSNSGAAYAFRFDGTTWSEEQKVAASDGGGGDEFGQQIALWESTLVAGAFLADGAFANQGAAYVLELRPESRIRVSGIAAGGDILLDIAALPLVVPSAAAENPSAVAASVAAAIDADPRFGALEIEANALGDEIFVIGVGPGDVGVSTTDSGLRLAAVVRVPGVPFVFQTQLQLLGGPSRPGGLFVSPFGAEEGELSASYTLVPRAALVSILEHTAGVNFELAGDPLPVWDLDYAGTSESVYATFGYDDSGLSLPEEDLAIHEFRDGRWAERGGLSAQLNTTLNRITAQGVGVGQMVLGGQRLAREAWDLSGISQGGTLVFTVGAVRIEITPPVGLTAEGLAIAIAEAINTETTLQSAGITAQVAGSRVLVDGAVTSLVNGDPVSSHQVAVDSRGVEKILTGAVFEGPGLVTTDPSGNVFVALQGDRVMKRHPFGTVTQVIGPDGDGAGNPLTSISGLATDSAGNLFVSGRSSRNVFQVPPIGTVSEILDEAAVAAAVGGFFAPEALAVDSNDNLYIVNDGGPSVLRRTPIGDITEIIDSTGDGSNAFGSPGSIVVYSADSADNILVVGGNQVFHASPLGGATLLLSFVNSDTDLAVDDAEGLYVTLFGQVHRVDLLGGPPSLVFDGAIGDGAGNTTNCIDDLEVDSVGNLYVTGNCTDNAFRVTPGGVVAQVISASGDGSGNPLDHPNGLTIDASDNVYVTGLSSDNLFQIAAGGGVAQIVDSTGNGLGLRLSSPSGLAADTGGNVYVSGRDSDNVFRLASDGTTSEIIDAAGDGAGAILDVPVGVAVDASGNVFVAGQVSDNVLRIEPGGAISEIIDATGDGAGNMLQAPSRIATDAAGNLYVAGSLSDNVFEVTPGGAVSQIVSSAGDGLGNGLNGPTALAVDSNGDVIVADLDDVFRVTPGGAAERVFDVESHTGPALFTALATDENGNTYVALTTTPLELEITALVADVIEISATGTVTQVVDDLDLLPFGIANCLVGSPGFAVDTRANLLIGGACSNIFQVAPDGSTTVLAGRDGIPTPTAPTNFALGPMGDLYLTSANDVFRISLHSDFELLGIGEGGQLTARVAGASVSVPTSTGQASAAALANLAAAVNADSQIAGLGVEASVAGDVFTLTGTRADRMSVSSSDPGFSLATWTRVGPNSAANSLLGGQGIPGGVGFDFDLVSAFGDFAAELSHASIVEVASLFAPVTFVASGDKTPVWNLSFDGSATGDIGLTFSYEDAGLLVPEESVRVYRFVAPTSGCSPGVDCGTIRMQILARDMVENTITIQTSGLGEFVLGGAVSDPVAWLFRGKAQGGAIDFTVEGFSFSVVTSPGQTGAQVAALVAAAINGNPTLPLLGVAASANASGVVTTNGIVSNAQSTDPGIIHTELARLPSASPWALWLLCTLMAVPAARVLRRRT